MLTRRKKELLYSNASNYLNLGQNDEAIILLKQIAEGSSNDPDAYSKIALLLIENNLEINAIEIFGQALKNNPNDEKLKESALKIGEVIEGKWAEKINQQKKEERML